MNLDDLNPKPLHFKLSELSIYSHGFYDYIMTLVLVDGVWSRVRVSDLIGLVVGENTTHTHSLSEVFVLPDDQTLFLYTDGTSLLWKKPSFNFYNKTEDYPSYRQSSWRDIMVTKEHILNQLADLQSNNYSGNSSLINYCELISYLFSPNQSYASATLLFNCKVILIPKSTNKIVYFDYEHRAVTESKIELDSVDNGFSSGVLLKNGYVCLVPWQDNRIVVIDPYKDTIVKQYSIPNYLTYMFRRGLLTLSGRVLLIPNTSDKFYEYDPETNSLNLIGNVPAGIYQGYLATALIDGSILLVPKNDGFALLYNGTDLIQLFRVYVPDSEYISTLMDNRVLVVPHITTSSLRVIDLDNETVSSVETCADSEFKVGVLLADGRVYLSPYSGAKTALYDPQTNTLNRVKVSSGLSGSEITASLLLPDGSLLLINRSGRELFLVTPSINNSEIPLALLTSPLCNRSI